MEDRPRPGWTRLAAKLAVSIAIVAVIFWKTGIDLTSVAKCAWSMDPLLLAAAVAISPIQMLARAARWRRLVLRDARSYSLLRAVAAHWGATAIGVFTPGRVGEFAKAGYAKRDSGISWAAAARSTVSDRGYDLLFLGGLAIGAYAYFFLAAPGALVAMGLAVYLAAAIATLHAARRVAGLLRPRLGRLSPAAEFVERMAADLTGRGAIGNLALTAVSFLSYYTTVYCLLCALAPSPPPYFEMSLISALTGVAVLLPISVAGFGPREAVLVLLLGRYSISADAAVSLALLDFAVFHVLVCAIGVGWLTWLHSNPATAEPDQDSGLAKAA